MKRKRDDYENDPGPTRRKVGSLKCLSPHEKVRFFIKSLSNFLSTVDSISIKRILVTLLYEIEFEWEWNAPNDRIPNGDDDDDVTMSFPFERVQDRVTSDLICDESCSTFFEDKVVSVIQNFFKISRTLTYCNNRKEYVNLSLFHKAPEMHFIYQRILKKLNEVFGLKNPDSKYSIIEEYTQEIVKVLKRETEEYIRMKTECGEGQSLYRNNFTRIKYFDKNFEEVLVDGERKVIHVGNFGKYAIVIGYFSDREVFVENQRLMPVQYKLLNPNRDHRLLFGERSQAASKIKADFKDPNTPIEHKRELLYLTVKKLEFLNQLDIEKQILQSFFEILRIGLGDRMAKNFFSMSRVMFCSQKLDDELYISINDFLRRSFKNAVPTIAVPPKGIGNQVPSISPIIVGGEKERIEQRRRRRQGRLQNNNNNNSSIIMVDEDEEGLEGLDNNNNNKKNSSLNNMNQQQQQAVPKNMLKLFCDQEFFRSHFSNEVNQLHTISKEEIRGIVQYVNTWRRIPKFDCYQTLQRQEKKFILLCLAPLIEDFLVHLPKRLKRKVKEMRLKKKKRRRRRKDDDDDDSHLLGMESYYTSRLRNYHSSFFTRNSINFLNAYSFIAVLLGRDPIHVERWAVTEIFSLGLYKWDDMKYDSTHRIVMQKNSENFLALYQRVWQYNHQNLSFQHCEIRRKTNGRLSLDRYHQRRIDIDNLRELEEGYYFRIDDLSKGREYFPVVLENTKDYIPYLQIRYKTKLNGTHAHDVESICGSTSISNNMSSQCQCLKLLRKRQKKEKILRVYYSDDGKLIKLDDSKVARSSSSAMRGSRSPRKQKRRTSVMMVDEDEDYSNEHVIAECGKFCACTVQHLKCKNKVTQTKPRLNVVIRKHAVKCAGWCVVARTRISAGSFVAEYVGEIIEEDEAMERGKFYDREGLSYLFDMIPQYLNDDNKFSLDAYETGNFTRYFNHSCDPNLITQNFMVGNSGNDMCRIAFFTKKDVEPGEQLTFDYHYEIDEESPLSKRMKCYCGSKVCRTWFR